MGGRPLTSLLLFAQQQVPEEQTRQVGVALTVWAMLAFLSILLIAIGGIWFLVRFGRQVKPKHEKAPRTVYHDLSVGESSDDADPASDDGADADDPEGELDGDDEPSEP